MSRPTILGTALAAMTALLLAGAAIHGDAAKNRRASAELIDPRAGGDLERFGVVDMSSALARVAEPTDVSK